MGRIFMSGVHWLLSALGITVQAAEYRLMIIEEEAVPLAAGDGLGMNHYFLLTLMVMAVASLVLALAVYLHRCMKYRRLLADLCGGRPGHYAGWNLRRLREVTLETELELAGDDE